MNEIETKAAMEAFMARGGKIIAISEGIQAVSSDRANRAFYIAARTGEKVKADSEIQADQDHKAEILAERKRDAFTAARMDGWTRENAIDYATNVNRK